MRTATTASAALLLLSLCCSCGNSQPPPPVEPDPTPPVAEAITAEPTASAESKPKAPAPTSEPVVDRPAQRTAPTPRPGAFTLPPDLSVSAMTGQGDNLYVAIGSYKVGEGKVARISRGGAQQVHAGPGGGVRMRMVGPRAVATGPLGMFAIHDGKGWIYRLAPAIEGEGVGAVTVAQGGTTYIAGEDHALYAQKGETFTTHRYPPSQRPDVMEAVMSAGTLYLIGSRGHVMSFTGGSFKQETISGLSSGNLSKPWRTSWVDRGRLTVWLAGDKTITSIDLKAKAATTHQSAMFFDVKTMAGIATAKGPLMMVGTFGKTALFDGQSWYEADGEGAETVYIDGVKKHGYAAGHDKIRVIDLAHPYLGTGPGKPFTR